MDGRRRSLEHRVHSTWCCSHGLWLRERLLLAVGTNAHTQHVSLRLSFPLGRENLRGEAIISGQGPRVPRADPCCRNPPEASWSSSTRRSTSRLLLNAAPALQPAPPSGRPDRSLLDGGLFCSSARQGRPVYHVTRPRPVHINMSQTQKLPQDVLRDRQGRLAASGQEMQRASPREQACVLHGGRVPRMRSMR